MNDWKKNTVLWEHVRGRLNSFEKTPRKKRYVRGDLKDE